MQTKSVRPSLRTDLFPFANSAEQDATVCHRFGSCMRSVVVCHIPHSIVETCFVVPMGVASQLQVLASQAPRKHLALMNRPSPANRAFVDKALQALAAKQVTSEAMAIRSAPALGDYQFRKYCIELLRLSSDSQSKSPVIAAKKSQVRTSSVESRHARRLLLLNLQARIIRNTNEHNLLP